MLHKPKARTQYVEVTVGEIIIETSVPISEPPHEDEYQLHIAFVPNDPPVNDNVEAPPGQTPDGEAAVREGAAERELTIILEVTQFVEPQAPSALTKYVTEDEGLNINDEPEPIKDPPQEPEYQFQLPEVPNDPPDTLRVV